MELYTQLGAIPRQAFLEWQFPAGGRLKMAHLEHEDTVYNYQGSQIPLVCVAAGTKIVTKDGLKPIEDISIGTFVKTLNGFSKVSRIIKNRKPCVKVSIKKNTAMASEQIQSVNHPILTSFGWFSWDDLKYLYGKNSSSIRRHGLYKSCSPADHKSHNDQPTFESNRVNRERVLEQSPQSWRSFWNEEKSFFSKENQNYSEESYDESQATEQPLRLCVPLMLFSPEIPSDVLEEPGTSGEIFSVRDKEGKLRDTLRRLYDYFREARGLLEQLLPSMAEACVVDNVYIKGLVQFGNVCRSLSDRQFQDFLLFRQDQSYENLNVLKHEVCDALRSLRALDLKDDCCLSDDQYDAPPHHRANTFRSYLRQLNDVVEQVFLLLRQKDDLLLAPQCNPTYRIDYNHPYSSEALRSDAFCEALACELTPIDEHDVYDLTVDNTNHYITESGIINQNCFDELTHFDEHSFWYLQSRLRSTSGIRGYVRATTNPSPGWVADLISWWIDSDGYPIKERSGLLRWFIRQNDAFVWADTKEELIKQYGQDQIPKSLTFIPSLLFDNKILMESDPTYLSNLKALSRVDRMRLLEGNWKVRATSGEVFNRSWFPVIDAIPSGWTSAVRFWDRAASKASETNRDPDWTRGLLLYKYPDNTFLVADLKSMRDTPGQVENLIKNTASHDSYDVQIMSQQDPGSAGVAEAENFVRMLAGYHVTTQTFSKSKLTRAKPVSAQAEVGNIRVLRRPWNDEFFSELENFSPEEEQTGHDDIVDCLSGSFNGMTQGVSILDCM